MLDELQTPLDRDSGHPESNTALELDPHLFIKQRDTLNGMRPEEILRKARLLASRQLSQWKIERFADDVAADFMVLLYGSPTWGREKMVIEIGLHIWALARHRLTEAKKIEFRHAPESVTIDGETYSAYDYVKSQRASQFDTILAKQAMDVIMRLPIDLKRMALKMVDGANLIECGAELNIKLLDAVKLQKTVWSVARRLMEDDADEKKFHGLTSEDDR